MKVRTMMWRWTFPLTLSLLLASCSHNPVTGKKEFRLLSEKQEISLGRQNYLYMQQVQGGAYCNDPELENYVRSVGNKLAAKSDRPHLPYEFVILNHSVPNAWSLPGGKIGINRGLLLELQNEAELAAVLSHEIVHSAARHSAKQLERGLFFQTSLAGLDTLLQSHKYEDLLLGSAALSTTLIQLKYSRKAEFEADSYGIAYMAAAGYNPYAAVSLQKTFLRLAQKNSSSHSPWLAGLFASHPPSEARIQANQNACSKYPDAGYIGKEAYITALSQLRASQEAYKKLDLGYEALEQNKPALARDLAREGIVIQSKEAHLYNLKGKAEMQLKEYAKAFSSFTRAIELNPKYFDFYLQRGTLNVLLSDRPSAQSDLEKSQELLPSSQASYLLGKLFLEKRDLQTALAYFQMAAETDDSWGKEAKNELRNL